MRGAHFGAAGRRKLTEMCAPRRGDSTEGSSWWHARGEAKNAVEVASEHHLSMTLKLLAPIHYV
jgi:hypothetical protein